MALDLSISPGPLSGTVAAIPSKSQAHRLLICAALADRPTELACPKTNEDIEATADCLRALGADIRRTDDGFLIWPISRVPEQAILPCRESGSTLRFLLPVAGALGVDGTFLMAGRLPQRPLSPLWEELERMGCTLERTTEHSLRITGTLRPGDYSIDGGVSSQFISGLLFALPLLGGQSHLAITGKAESLPYIHLTTQALAQFGAAPTPCPGGFSVAPARLHSPGRAFVEGDWSNAAFWLAAQALGSNLTVAGLEPDSPQGDRAVSRWLPLLCQSHQTIDAAQTPDLVPILAVVAAARHGATFTNCARLRLKESDRLASTAELITRLGGRAQAEGDTLHIWGTGLSGGIVQAGGDHRLAMSAAIAATVCSGPVMLYNAQTVSKSDPNFWRDFESLGGHYEQFYR